MIWKWPSKSLKYIWKTYSKQKQAIGLEDLRNTTECMHDVHCIKSLNLTTNNTMKIIVFKDA